MVVEDINGKKRKIDYKYQICDNCKYFSVEDDCKLNHPFMYGEVEHCDKLEFAPRNRVF